MVASSGYGHAVADELSSDPMMRRDPSMTRDQMSTRRDSQVRRAPNSSGLYDVLDLILDKGIVIDAFVRVSLVGIELLTIDLRVVIASVDTYLRYAEGVERLQVYDRAGSKRLGDIVGGGMKTAAISKGASSIGKALGGKSRSDDDDDDDDNGKDNAEDNGGLTGTLTRGVKSVMGRLIGSDDDDDDGDDAKQSDRPRQQEQRRRLPGREGGERQPPPRRSSSEGARPAGARR